MGRKLGQRSLSKWSTDVSVPHSPFRPAGPIYECLCVSFKHKGHRVRSLPGKPIKSEATEPCSVWAWRTRGYSCSERSARRRGKKKTVNWALNQVMPVFHRLACHLKLGILPSFLTNAMSRGEKKGGDGGEKETIPPSQKQNLLRATSKQQSGMV